MDEWGDAITIGASFFEAIFPLTVKETPAVQTIVRHKTFIMNHFIQARQPTISYFFPSPRKLEHDALVNDKLTNPGKAIGGGKCASVNKHQMNDEETHAQWEQGDTSDTNLTIIVSTVTNY